MGACIAKPARGKLFGNSQSSQTKDAKRQSRADRLVQNKRAVCAGEEASTKKKKTLKEIQLESPPGFKKFEMEVDWQTIDEDIALQLWEDVFKPLYTL